MTPLAYSIKSAAVATGLSQTRISQAIHAGELRARRSSVTEDGEPTGKYVILHADLVSFLEGLVTA